MNAMLTFAPFLALVAFLSVEVSAEIVAHTGLVEGGFTDGFTSMSYSYTAEGADKTTVTILPTAAGGCDGMLEGCELPKAGSDLKSVVTIMAEVPAAASLSVDPDAGAPAEIVVKQCFSETATTGRKWRKMNDPFKKDNSCKTAASGDIFSANATYPAEGGAIDPIEFIMPDTTPTSELTFRAYVKCDGNTDGNYCHVVNYKPTGAVYYPTEAMDNRPAGLFTAVMICAFIGPLLLAAFLVYERGVLANKSQ